MEGNENEELSTENESICSTKTKYLNKPCDFELESILLTQRLTRNELVLRFLSFLCGSLMFGLFILQMDILWQAREVLVMDMVRDDARYFLYPEYFDRAHEEETWDWDPDTMLLRVNTSVFVH